MGNFVNTSSRKFVITIREESFSCLLREMKDCLKVLVKQNNKVLSEQG